MTLGSGEAVNSVRPDITVMVDWALKVNSLSIYVNSVEGLCRNTSPLERK